ERAQGRESPVDQYAIGDIFSERSYRFAEGREQQGIVEPARVNFPNDDESDEDRQPLYCVVAGNALVESQRALDIADDGRIGELRFKLRSVRRSLLRVHALASRAR